MLNSGLWLILTRHRCHEETFCLFVWQYSIYEMVQPILLKFKLDETRTCQSTLLASSFIIHSFFLNFVIGTYYRFNFQRVIQDHCVVQKQYTTVQYQVPILCMYVCIQYEKPDQSLNRGGTAVAIVGSNYTLIDSQSRQARGFTRF